MDAVTRALCPTVHCFATPDVDQALERNHLASLSHLVQPFIGHLDQVQLRLPSTYEQRTAPHFHLHLVDRQLPHPSSSSSSTPHPAAATPSFHQPLALRDELFLDHLGQRVALTAADPDSRPPYPLVRDAVLARKPDDYCVPHESFAHPVACLVALSTSHPDPLNALAHLWDLTSPRNLFRTPDPHDDPRAEYASPDVLRFVVLVHDHGAPQPGPDAARDAQKLLDTVRKTYGNHSALVDLFSAADSTPDPRPRADEAELRRLWQGVVEAQAQQRHAAAQGAQDGVIGLGFDTDDGADARSLPPAASGAPEDAPPATPGHELSAADLGALRQLAREFVVQSLVPFLEQRAVVLHEQWQASRRGIGGRLFSVGRKYFGGGGGASAGASGGKEGSREGSSGAGKEGYNAAKGYYHHSSPSSLARRLADTAFFLGDYKLAYSVYDACAKDYRADKAARHAAAAMRMTAICAVLLLPPSLSPSTSSSSAPPPQLIANPEALLAGAAALSPLHGTLVDFDALRSTLVLVALYALHPPLAPLAPLALVRAAGDAEEIVAAVLLEEAAGAELRAGGRWPHAHAAERGARAEGEAPEDDGREDKTRERRAPRSRKHAFWTALAAARYEKCGVKSLSRRCLSQAAALYLPSPSSTSDPSLPPPISSLASPTSPPPTDPAQWSAIRTHLHHALARQSYTVGAAQDSVDNFLALLGTGSGPFGSSSAASSSSTAGFDGGAGAAGDGAASDAPEWLDDFALAWDLLASSSSSTTAAPHDPVALPVRLFDAPNARLRVGSARQAGLSAGAGDEREWARLEKALLARAEFDVGGAGSRPSALGYRGGAGAGASVGGGAGRGAGALEPVEAVLGETLTLEVPVRNPLEAFLALGALAVEVRREGEGGAEGEGEGGAGLEVSAPQDVELAPGEFSKILIPIRASSLGTFTFDSLSYRFSNLVPVREPLSPARWSKPTAPRPGHPSARVALPLRVRVRAAVPVLGVDMSALPSRLFHGEQSGDDQSTTTIVVRNEGPVPLTDLHALSSEPDSLLLRPAPPTLDADGALSTPNDLAAPRPTALLEPGRALAPGEELAVPVVVRGSRVGAHALCVLFAFRAVDDELERGKGAREYLSTRAVHGVEVYPSLELRYGVRPGRRHDSPLVLGLEVYNVGLPADDVSISAISLLSPRWRISPSADSSAFDEDVTTQRIGWQQGLTSFVPLAAVARGGEGPSEEADMWTAGQVEALLDGKDVKGMPPRANIGVSSLAATSSTSTSPISPSALCGLIAAYTSDRRASLVERYPTVPPSFHPSLFPLFSSRAASLVVTFTSSTLSLAPAHLLVPLDAPYLGSALGSPAAGALVRVLVNAERRSGGLYEESRRERRALLTVLKRSEIIGAAGTDEAPPVSVNVAVRGVVEHDFSSSGPLSLPLRLSLSSLSPSTTFSYTLSLSSPSSRTGAGAILSGALTHRGSLGPLGRATVDAQLWVPRPGTFAAGAWDLVLSWEGRDEQEQGGSVRLSGGAREVRVRDRGAAAAGGKSAGVALEEAARVQVRA